MIERRWGSVVIVLVALVCNAPGLASAQGAPEPSRPVAGPAPALHLPRIVTRRLSNGVTVAVLENHNLPLVSVTLELQAPALLDPAGKEGVGRLTAAMMSEGTTTLSADALANAEADLGSTVSAVGFFTITENVDRSLELMADQLLHPAFPQPALVRIKANSVARLQRLRSDAQYLAGRVFANAVYGAGHPYARHETEGSVASITRDDLVAFHRDYYRPRNATLIVAGDITPDAAAAKLEHAFGRWEGGGLSGTPRVPPPRPAAPTRIYLYDRPGSPQTTILMGQIGPPRDTKEYYAIELLNTILGGAFNSRLNLDLREAHGWTYGAGSGILWRRVPQPSTWEAETAVSTPTTDSAVASAVADVRAIRTTRPASDSEVAFAKRTITLSLPLEFATIQEMAAAAADLFEFDLPLDYYDHLTANFERVTTDQLRAVAERDLDPSHEVIAVVGDKAAIAAGLDSTHVAPVEDVRKQF
jgi:zinc protease